MPAVNLPPHQTQGNVTLSSAPSAQLRLIINLSVAAAGILIVFAIRLASQFRTRRLESQRLASNLTDPGAIRKHHWPVGLPRVPGFPSKSRGVSNFNTPVMSAHQSSDFSVPKEDGDLEKKHDGSGRRWSEDSTDGSHGHESISKAIGISVSQNLASRPPPPPPLTPPKLSAGNFTFEERRMSAAMSTMGDLDASFFHLPNPDYMSSSEGLSSGSSAVPQTHGSPVTPRRRSYTKMLPLGPPQPVSTLELDGSITSFSPSSFPSSSPILPLAPHSSFSQKEIDVQGEIISVMDDSGAGWKRHTRVYGGGVCLACMASGGEGGFYGEKVRPEERR